MKMFREYVSLNHTTPEHNVGDMKQICIRLSPIVSGLLVHVHTCACVTCACVTVPALKYLVRISLITR